MAAKIVAEAVKAKITEYAKLRTDWSEGYVNDLISRIDKLFQEVLGVNAKIDLKNATSSLKSIEVPAKKDLSMLKLQLEEGFRKQPKKRDDILIALGSSKYYRAAQSGNQESLIALLYNIKTNLSDKMRSDILATGITPELLDRILNYANDMAKANEIQESSKGKTKETTAQINKALEDIYREIIAICKILSRYHSDDPVKKEQFTFSKVVKNLGGNRSVKSEAGKEVAHA
jgi:hypothetical protein